jgi:polar amino acid transport system substrate-binding protein
MKGNRYVIILILAGLLSPMLYPKVAAQDTSLSDVLAAGELLIGTDATYPPFESYNASADEFEGFDIDLAEYICAELGVTAVFMDTGWDVIFTSLAGGSFDCIISAVTITAERELSMDFSRWYYKSQQALLVTVANPKGLTSIDDVNVSTVEAGFQLGTTSDILLDDYEAQQVAYPTITFAIAALEAGSIDCVLGDQATLESFIKTQPGVFQVVDTFSPEDFGIPVQTGADALRNRINEILDGLLGSDVENPSPSDDYNDMHKLWFDTDAIGYAATRVQIPGYPVYGIFIALSIGAYVLMRKMKRR